MNLKNRCINTLDIIRGPFKVRENPELRISTRRERSKTASRKLLLSDAQKGIDAGNSDYLPVHVSQFNPFKDQLSLDLPANSILEQATLLGWKPVWNGSQASYILDGTTKNRFQLAIPARGWWRVSTPAATTDLLIYYPRVSSPHERISPLAKVRRWVKEGSSRFVPLAIASHAAILLLFLFKTETLEVISKILPKLETPEMAEAPGAAPIEVVENTVSDDEDAFNGRSLFAPPRTEETKAKNELNKEALSNRLKSLSGLMKQSAPSVVVVKNAQSKPNNLASAFANSLSQLNGKIGSGGSGSGTAGTLPTGTPKVNWKPQFLATSGGKGSSLSDGQERQLLEAFSKLQDRFRDCYETALLKFDELSVSVQFEGVIGSSGKIGSPKFTVNGRSTDASRDALTQCLGKVVQEMSVDKKGAGIRIKRQFIFK